MNLRIINVFRKPRTFVLTIFALVLIIFFAGDNLKGAENVVTGSLAKISELKSPVRIDFGKKDMIYVSDYIGKRVLIIKIHKLNLRIKKEIRVNGYPLGVAVFDDKYVFVGNESKNTVQVYRENGKYSYSLGKKVKGPNDIAISTKEKIYVVASFENMIKVFDLSGEYIFSFGNKGDGDGEFNYPTGIEIDDKNDEVIVSDFMNKRIQVFDMDGNWLRTFGGGMLFSIIDRPQGISIDKKGNYHIVDSKQACIHIFNTQGVHLGIYGEYGKKEGQLRTPLDIVFDNSGNAFVTSNLNKKVEIFRGASK